MAWGAVVGAGISAIGSLLSNQMQNNSNSNLNKENRQFQWAQMLKQQQWSEQMWQKENEYNTPLAQRKRLQEAGYNPWISGSGGMSNVAQTPSNPGTSSAPVSAPMKYDNPFGNLAMTVNDTLRAKAESVNQLSQAAQNAVNTAVALYEKTGDFESAEKYLDTSLKAIGGANFNKNSQYFQMLELAIQGKQLENVNQDLQNAYQSLQNDLVAKYGDKEASAKIANLEQLTTKYVGELGLMSAQADKYRSDVKRNESEIKLNASKAYELGARAASEFAQAGLFGSEAAINNGVYRYVVGNAFLDYNSNKLNYISNKANFDSESKIRDWLRTGSAKTSKLAVYNSSPDNNPFFAFMKGFSDSAPVKIGMNYNFGKSQSFGSSWIYNAKDFYPTP